MDIFNTFLFSKLSIHFNTLLDKNCIGIFFENYTNEMAKKIENNVANRKIFTKNRENLIDHMN